MENNENSYGEYDSLNGNENAGDWVYLINSTQREYYDDFYTNKTNDTLTLHGGVGYSTLHIIISSVILTFMMIVVVVGNMLVIIAISTEKTLKNIQNWFIASLAVADFFVGLLIMPFSLANELMGYWIFGSIFCSVHSALDVLLCTSSIMNICLISLDRYWSITQAVDYLKKRTPGRAAVMICMVWVLSALISIPPLLGWRDPDAQAGKELPACQLSREIGYVLYSALGSFYIPSCIMVFVYIRIYFAARARARRCVRKVPRPKPQSSSIEVVPVTKVPLNISEVPCSDSPKVPLSAPPFLVTTPAEVNNSSNTPGNGGGHRTSLSPGTPEGRTMKQVGFQEPLVCCTSSSEIVVRPEITVESCSPEDSGEVESLKVEQENSNNFEELNERTTKSCDCEKVISGESDGSEVEEHWSEKGGLKETRIDQDSHLIQNQSVSLDDAGDFVEISSPLLNVQLRLGGCSGDDSVLVAHEDNKDSPRGSSKHSSPLVVPPELKSSSDRVVFRGASNLLQSNGGNRADDEIQQPLKKSKRPKLHFLRVDTPAIWRTTSSLSLNGDVHILGTLSRSCSRLQLDNDPVSDVEPSSSDSGAVGRCVVVKPLKLRLCQPFFGKKSHSSTSGKARRDALDMGKLPSPKQEIRDPEREKRRIARKKEKRATLILGLIMGSFILCWLPFFFLYILEPLCPSCKVEQWGFAIAFWLGYMNSALNPVIYTIFNKDFRRAFRRILFK